MNSATSTKAPVRDSGFRPWQFYVPFSMIAATVAVAVSKQTHPAALLLLSGAVISAGLVGLAIHHALLGFFSDDTREPVAAAPQRRDILAREKALALRSIKELEFDHNMGKVSDTDFARINERLRERAMSLMQELERVSATVPAAVSTPVSAAAPTPAATRACPECSTGNDIDARFCKQCGARLPTDNKKTERAS